MKRNIYIWIILILILIIILVILLKFTNLFQTSTNNQLINQDTVFEKKQIMQEKNYTQNFVVKKRSKNNANNLEINNSKSIILQNPKENKILEIQKFNKSKIKITLNSETKVIFDDILQNYKHIGNIYLKGNFTKQEIEKIKRQLRNKKGIFLIEKEDNSIIVTLIKPIKIISNKISLDKLSKIKFLKINKNYSIYYVDKSITKENYKKIINILSNIKYAKVIIVKDENKVYVYLEKIKPISKEIIDSNLSWTINKYNLCENILTVHFNFDSYDINKSNEIKLKSLKKEIKVFMPTQIVIIGHTDNIGPKIYNQKLSMKRAETVNKFLDFNNSKIKGYGEEKPIVPNDTPKNRALNRRAEIILCY